MLSMFARKAKAKVTTTAVDVESNGVRDNCSKVDESICTKISNKSPASKSFQSGAQQLRASSASPQSVAPLRRASGITVTFESTLPTQVWQASPSPSPPLLSNDQRELIYQRMASSLSDDDRSHRRYGTEQRLRAHRKSDSFHNWIKDMDADDSSDETNPSGYSHASQSSCSSSDESLTGADRPECKTSSSTTTVTTDSSSSLDLRIVSNSDGNLVQSVSSAITKRNFTGEQRQQQHQRKKDRSLIPMRKSNSEKKRRNIPIHAVSSSSSSSSDEDLEALGWDERTISALTNRSKSRQIAALRQSTTSHNLGGKFAKKNTKESLSATYLNCNPNVSENNQASTACIPLHPLPPLRMGCEQVYLGTTNTINHPQSCVLARRTHHLTEQQMSYSDRSHRTLNSKSKLAHVLTSVAGQCSDLLATITENYTPLVEWEQQYKVIPVRKGDYVCVLSRPMQSRSNSETSTSGKHRAHGRNGQQHRPNTMALTNTSDETNTWLYVRRWCIDHLVATGPPGFVPKHYCRLLSSSELLQLWHQNQASRTHQMNTSVPISTSITDQGSDSACTQSLTEHKYSLQNGNCEQSNNLQNMVANACSLLTNSSNSMHRIQVPYCSYKPDPIRYTFAYPISTGCVNHVQIPPPPPGFGSGGSLGSETEDRDSGRGPSSGSEWGSGRGGSSSVTLDQSLGMVDKKTASDVGIERRPANNTDRGRNVKSAEESQLSWYAPDGSVWSSEPCSSNRDDGIYSHDSALQSPNDSDLTPQLPNRTLPDFQLDGSSQTTSGQTLSTSPLMLTTRTSYTPVLEMRPAGTPTLYARELPLSLPHGTDSLATSTTTCATVIEAKARSDPEIVSITDQRSTSPDPACWEPYQTVVHVNKNSLEKFTLV